ncbi:MAG: hypothetical protein ACR2RB_15585 [Gammaproteobacteria bacterium]
MLKITARHLLTTMLSTLCTLMVVACGNGGDASNTGSPAGGLSGGDGTAALSWTPPTTNIDGSALLDLAGYRIYYGTESQSYTEVKVVENIGVADTIIDGLQAGTYYFAATAIDTSGNESAFSNEVFKTIQ